VYALGYLEIEGNSAKFVLFQTEFEIQMVGTCPYDIEVDP
jgi:hypothetical protein